MALWGLLVLDALVGPYVFSHVVSKMTGVIPPKLCSSVMDDFL